MAAKDELVRIAAMRIDAKNINNNLLSLISVTTPSIKRTLMYSKYRIAGFHHASPPSLIDFSSYV